MEVTLRYRGGVFVPETPLDLVDGQVLRVRVRTPEEIAASQERLGNAVANLPSTRLPPEWDFRREDLYD